MSEEDKTISPEQYDTLMEKLGTVEELFEKAPKFEEYETKMSEMADTIEKQATEIDALKNAEPASEPVDHSEDISKMTETIESMQADIEKIQETPLIKGAKDGADPKDPKIEKDVNDLDISLKVAYGM